jgi:beta-glucosidase
MSKTFPENFVWGSATASFQIEGAAKEYGRGRSIWDTFCDIPENVESGHNGDIACDHYHLFEEDVKMMQELGLQAYRFSIAWPRIQPDGKGDVNQQGIDFYNRLIDCLLEHGIEPWVTLYHWDLPLALQIENDGWLNKDIVGHFEKYSRICFENFGDRVKNWITLNEPWCTSVLGYGIGVHAPGHISKVKPYLAAHNLILSHARAYHVYKNEFANQNGSIGITNNCDFRYALTDKPEDVAAAERSMEFFLAWFADPIWKGDYPLVIKERVGERLPKFTDAEKTEVFGSSDFFGLNHYTAMMASEPNPDDVLESNIAGNGGMIDDQQVFLSNDPSWDQTYMQWNIVPEGCRDLLKWIDARYDHPIIYITENGCACDEPNKDIALKDIKRKNFYESYLRESRNAIDSGVDLRGYFAWSLMDNFEWAFGYNRRFGICYVDYETLERTPKLSARWLRDSIAQNGANI